MKPLAGILAWVASAPGGSMPRARLYAALGNVAQEVAHLVKVWSCWSTTAPNASTSGWSERETWQVGGASGRQEGHHLEVQRGEEAGEVPGVLAASAQVGSSTSEGGVSEQVIKFEGERLRGAGKGVGMVHAQRL